MLEHTISTLSAVSVDAGKTTAAQATLLVTSAVPAATHAAADGSERVWLFLGIPTVPRRNDVDYLTTYAPHNTPPCSLPMPRRISMRDSRMVTGPFASSGPQASRQLRVMSSAHGLCSASSLLVT